MAKLKYKDGDEWKSMAPSQEEFDELKDQVAQDKLDKLDKLDYEEQRLLDLQDIESKRQQDQLKVAKVEKDINDYQQVMSQVNVNQEAKQQASGYGIVSLPKNAANGQVSVSLKGETITNVFDGQALNESGEYSEYEWDNITKILTNLKGFDNDAWATKPSVGIKPSTTYTFICDILYDNTTLAARDTSGVSLITGVTLNKGKYITKFTTTASQETFAIKIYDPNGVDVKSIQYPLLIEGDWTTATYKPNYIDGTKSTVSAMRLKSVGKNLFDKSKILLSNTLTLSADGIYTSINDGRNHISIFNNVSSVGATISQERLNRLVKLKANQTYRITATDGSGGYLLSAHQRTKEGTILRSTYGLPLIFSLTTEPSSDGFIYLDIARQQNSVSFRDFQIEEGTTATPYEPYTESNSYFICKDPETSEILEARSVPSANDEINLTTGYKVQNVSDWTTSKNTGLLIAGISGEAWQVAGMTSAYFSVMHFDKTITLKSGVVNAYSPQYFNSDWEHYGANGQETFTINGTAKLCYIRVLNSKTGILDTDDISTKKSKFQTWLRANPITLIYQLAEPVEVPIEVSGTLLSNPSGTVYVEPVVADAGVYTDKIEVLHQDLPIKALEKLSKVDFMTGVETELDIDGIVIAENKLSFTHPELQDGDIVFFEYEYDVESTIPETEIEYYDSRYTIKDSVTDKFYKWNVTVADGVPSIELVEV